MTGSSWSGDEHRVGAGHGGRGAATTGRDDGPGRGDPVDRADELIGRMLAFEAPLAFRLYLRLARIWLTLWRGDVARAEAMYRESRSSMATLAGVEMQSRLERVS